MKVMNLSSREGMLVEGDLADVERFKKRYEWTISESE